MARASIRPFLASVVGVGMAACVSRIEVGAFGTALLPEGGSDAPAVPRVRVTAKPSKLAAGGASTCAIGPSGGVHCWGGNEYGELGVGSGQPVKSAVPLPVKDADKGTLGVSGSAFAYCSVQDSGVARCWGDSVFGKASASPEEIRGVHTVWRWPLDVYRMGEGIALVRSGLYFGVALTTDGRVRTWGLDGHGQLGQGSTRDGLVPADLPTNERFVDIAASNSGFFACGINVTGDVLCWGANDRGQLGNGSLEERTLPTKVDGLVGKAVEITCGRAHACARLETGYVACWGQGNLGQLGGGVLPPRPRPAFVLGLEQIAEVRAGHDHTCALVRGGEVRCWGSDDSGQLTGKLLGSREMGPFSSLHAAFGAETIAAGGKHSCAMAGAQVRCWGDDTSGQLGISGMTAVP